MSRFRNGPNGPEMRTKEGEWVPDLSRMQQSLKPYEPDPNGKCPECGQNRSNTSPTSANQIERSSKAKE
jgi:hypothetical protein